MLPVDACAFAFEMYAKPNGKGKFLYLGMCCLAYALPKAMPWVLCVAVVVLVVAVAFGVWAVAVVVAAVVATIGPALALCCLLLL